MTEIHLNANVTEQDFLRAVRLSQRHAGRSRWLYWLLIAYTGAALSITLALAVMLFSRDPLFSFFFVVLGLVAAMPYFYRHQLHPRQAYKAFLKLQPEAHVTASEKGLTIATPARTLTLGWERFDRLQQDSRIVLLSVPGGQYVILPKADFAGPEALEAFLKLAAERMAR